MYSEEDYLMLSGIQHFSFCRRQWALIHIEQQWAENYRTVEGNFLHEKVDSGKDETHYGTLVIRDMDIKSKELGASGTCDLVEFKEDSGGISLTDRDGLYSPIPVEYKRGKPKDGEVDELQLCAQGICLEEMLICNIPYGFLFYNETKRRTKVNFDNTLREQVYAMFDEMHELYSKRYTPKVKRTKSCNACSLKNICLPKLSKTGSAKSYFENTILGGEA